MLKENTLITNFQPHFHLRGKAMEVKAILPDGSTQVVSYVGKFNFNWMTNYIYADDAAPVFPKGTVIQVSAWYDNTKNNPNNPDPDQWVGYGDRTVDEMAHAWMNVVYLTDDEYKAWLDSEEGAQATVDTTAAAIAMRQRLAALALLASAWVLVCASRPRQQISRAASRLRREHHRRVRRLVQQRRRHAQLPDRLPEPQHQAGGRRPDRPEQPHRAGRSRSRAADALPARPPDRRVHRSRCRRISAPRSA